MEKITKLEKELIAEIKALSSWTEIHPDEPTFNEHLNQAIEYIEYGVAYCNMANTHFLGDNIESQTLDINKWYRFKNNQIYVTGMHDEKTYKGFGIDEEGVWQQHILFRPSEGMATVIPKNEVDEILNNEFVKGLTDMINKSS